MSLIDKWVKENPEYAEMNKLAQDVGFSDLNEFLANRKERIKNELDAKIMGESTVK